MESVFSNASRLMIGAEQRERIFHPQGQLRIVPGQGDEWQPDPGPYLRVGIRWISGRICAEDDSQIYPSAGPRHIDNTHVANFQLASDCRRRPGEQRAAVFRQGKAIIADQHGASINEGQGKAAFARARRPFNHNAAPRYGDGSGLMQ